MLFQVLRVGCFLKDFFVVFFIGKHSLNKILGSLWHFHPVYHVLFFCTSLQSCPFLPSSTGVRVLFPDSFLSTLLQKTSHAVFVFLRLADFTPHEALAFPPFPRKWLNLTFSSWLSKTPLYIFFFLLISQIFNFYILGVHTEHSTFSLCIKLMSIEADSVAWKLWLLLQ